MSTAPTVDDILAWLRENGANATADAFQTLLQSMERSSGSKKAAFTGKLSEQDDAFWKYFSELLKSATGVEAIALSDKLEEARLEGRSSANGDAIQDVLDNIGKSTYVGRIRLNAGGSNDAKYHDYIRHADGVITYVDSSICSVKFGTKRNTPEGVAQIVSDIKTFDGIVFLTASFGYGIDKIESYAFTGIVGMDSVVASTEAAVAKVDAAVAAAEAAGNETEIKKTKTSQSNTTNAAHAVRDIFAGLRAASVDKCFVLPRNPVKIAGMVVLDCSSNTLPFDASSGLDSDVRVDCGGATWKVRFGEHVIKFDVNVDAIITEVRMLMASSAGAGAGCA